MPNSGIPPLGAGYMKWSNKSLHRPRTSRGRRNPTSRLPQVRALLFGRELRFHFSSCCQLTAAASLQMPEVFRSALSDLLPTFPSKLDGGGIFLLRQNSKGSSFTMEEAYSLLGVTDPEFVPISAL